MRTEGTDKADVLQGTLILLVLRTLAADRADRQGAAAAQSGHSLSGALAHGAGRMDWRQVGSVREKPQSEILLHYGSRTETAGEGNRGLEAYVIDD